MTDFKHMDKNGIYTDRYYDKLEIKFTNEETYETIVIECGKYKAKYNTNNRSPQNSFGLDCWKASVHRIPTEISFYENDQLLFTKMSVMKPCLIIHCLNKEEQTNNNTFYCIRENYSINIYDMNNNFIRNTSIGPDCIVDFKRVNQHYAISITEEMCTYDPFTGLINLDIFFNQTAETPQIKAYDNSRTAVCLRSDSQSFGELRYFPLICTETGFVVEDLRTNEILSDIIPYDLVHQGEITFEDNEKESQSMKMYEMLYKCGFDINKINQEITQKGQVYINVKDIPSNI
jgi:hypothetical protein